MILTVTKNKMQLIDLIVADLTAHKTDFQTHTLVVVGRDPIPVDILKGSVLKLHDLTTTQEETNTIIIQQVARVESGHDHHHRRVIKPSFSIVPCIVFYIIEHNKGIQRAGICELGAL